MTQRLTWTCVLCLVATFLFPAHAAQAAPVQPPTLIPPVEANFYGGTQQMVAAPLGLAVDVYTLGLSANRTDLLLPGCDLPMQAAFVYTPGPDRRPAAPMGVGWALAPGAGYSQSATGLVTLGPIQGRMLQLAAGSDGLTSLPGGGYRYRAADGTVYTFDNPTHRQLTKMESPSDSYILLTYDAQARPTHMTDTYGRRLDLTYQDGHLIRVTDANESPVRVVHYEYDADGFMVRVIDPLGNVTGYEYANRGLYLSAYPQGYLSRITDPLGNWALIQYDSQWQAVLAISTPVSSVSYSHVEYESLIPTIQYVNYTTITDVRSGLARATRYDFDQRGLLRTITDPEGYVVTYLRDGEGRLVGLRDENNHLTRFSYDQAGRLEMETDPLGRTTHYTYDPASGKVASVTDAEGHTTRFRYDAQGRVIQVTDPLSNTYRYQYDCCHLITATDPLSHTTVYTYNAFGDLAAVRDAAGVTTWFDYNARGELVQTVDGRGNLTALERDAAGWVTAVTYPGSGTYRYVYDAAGNLIQQTDPAGRALLYTYDPLGQPLSIEDAIGKLSYDPDPWGNFRAITDEQGNQDSFTYDGNGRMLSRTDPLGRATRFAYDGAGNLIRRTDPLSQTTEYTYDAANQLVGVLYPDGLTVTLAYDRAGNLVRESNPVVSVDYAYDPAGRLISVTAAGQVVGYSYDAAGRRASLTDPTNRTIHYTYDGAGRLQSVQDPVVGTTSYHYDGAGNQSQVNHPNGDATQYAYDADNRMTSVVHWGPGALPLASAAYTLDPAGNRTQVVHGEYSPTMGGSGTTAYSYDARYRLTGVAYPDGTNTSYTYDPAGNRLTQNNTTYAYDAASQLTSAGATAYAWDPRGNQVQRTTGAVPTDYRYDHENRLVELQFADSTRVSYSYYPNGQLYTRTDRVGNTTRYLYDGANLLLETDATGNPLARYTQGVALDSWLGVERNGAVHTYLRDGLNSVVGVADASGSLVAAYRYDAFGNLLAQTGALQDPVRYTGRYWDADAALYQYRARWYDPTIGRFTSRDPLGPIATRQPYAYARNNPATFLDPLGLDTWSCDSGKASAGFLIGFEYTKLRCKNRSTGETCGITQRCFKLGALAGATFSGCGGLMFNGPANGSELAGSGFSAFGEASVGLGVGVEVEGNIATDDPMADVRDAQSEVGACAGAGYFGAEVGLGGQYCRTSVQHCERPEKPPASPRITRPPRSPGADHADDNYSAASAVLLPFPSPAVPASLLTPSVGPLPALVQPAGRRATGQPTGAPLVGVLWHGYAEAAQALLASYGWDTTPVMLDFDPDVLDLPVLLIPSGGLYGLDGSPSVRARLEAYAAAGGVILALAQQRGAEFGTLPQPIGSSGSAEPLGGYGWTEDNSCFESSLYISQYHPLVAGFDRAVLSAGVDGFFTQVPGSASRLLHRTKNGQPALVLYPFGEGWVAATTIYPDWARSNSQPLEAADRLLRDMVSWALDPRTPLLEFHPGETVSLPLTLTNSTTWDAAAAELVVLDNWGRVYRRQTIDVSVPSGGSSVTTVQVTGIGIWQTHGIWWVKVTLLAAGGDAIQPTAWGGRFLVSDPSPAVGPTPAMGMSITAPSEEFVAGPATFSFHVYNLTGQERSATVSYGLPHHTWQSGDPSYGDFYNHQHALTVAANSEYSFTYSAELFTNDRLFSRLQYGAELQFGWFQVQMVAPQVTVEIETPGPGVRRGQTASLAVTLNNRRLVATEVVLRLAVQYGQGAGLQEWNATQWVPARGSVTVPFSLTVPSDAALGTAEAKVAVQDKRGMYLDARSAQFTVAPSPLEYGVRLPDALRPGLEQTVWVTATNPSASSVLSATLAVTLTEPHGAETVLGRLPFVVPAGGQVLLPMSFTAPASQLGDYTFSFRAEDEYLTARSWQAPAPNRLSLELAPDRAAYAVRDQASVTVRVGNDGRWAFGGPLRIQLPATGYVQTDTLQLEPGARVSYTHVISLPAGLSQGSYPLSATLTLAAGPPVEATVVLVIPAGRLTLAAPAAAWTAGQPAAIGVANVGGVDVGGVWSASLRDRRGSRVQSASGAAGPVRATETAEITFTLPADITSGAYLLTAVVTDSVRLRADHLLAWIEVNGVEAMLDTQTAAVYVVGQQISTHVAITNGLLPFTGGDLSLSISGLAGEQWVEHNTGDHGPVADNTAILAPDAAGFRWVGYGASRYLSAWHDGGTPFDKSDDRWAHYYLSHNVTDLLIDPSGYLWVTLGNYSSTDPTGVVLWDTNGTPLDPSDDRWASFAAGSGQLLFRRVERVATDAAGRLWFAQPETGSSPTAVAVSVLDHGGTPFDPADDLWGQCPSSYFPLRGTVTDLAFDAADRLWVSVEHYLQGGVMVRDLNGTPFDPADDSADTFTGTRMPQDVDFDAAGRVWIAADRYSYDKGLYVWDFGASPFDGTGDTTTIFTKEDSGLLEDYYMDSLVIDDDDHTWVTASGYYSSDPAGLHLLDDNNTPANLTDDTWLVFSTTDGLASPRAPGLVVGAEGLIHLATYAGVNLLDTAGTLWDKTDDRWLTVNARESLADYRVSDVAVGDDNVVWTLDLGMTTASLLDWGGTPADKSDDRWAHMPVNAACLVRESSRYTWFGIYDSATTTGLAVVDTQSTPLNTADDSWAWFTTDACGLPDLEPLYLEQDEAGNLWLSGWLGICVLDPAGTPLQPEDDRWQSYTKSDGLPYVYNAPLAAMDGLLWTGGDSGAYLRDTNQTPFTKTDDVAVTFTTANGLPSNTVDYAIVPRPDGTVWIATANGVHLRDLAGTPMNKSDDLWINYTNADGLANNYVTAIALDAAGNIWFGTPTGVSRLDPGDDLFSKGDDVWTTWYTGRRFDDIAVGPDGAVWLASRNGLFQVTEAVVGTLWEHHQAIDLSAGQVVSRTVPASALTAAGKFWLQAELTSGRGQLVGADRYPFYVVKGQALLTLDVSPGLVRPGGAISLTGELVNFAAAPLDNQTLTIAQDGAVIYTLGPFSVPAGGSHPYATSAAAPLTGDETRFVAGAGELSVQEMVAVGRTIMSGAVTPVELANAAPFSLTVVLTNSGAFAGQVALTFPQEAVSVTVPPGETALVRSSTSVCGDSVLTISAGGDLTATWLLPVQFGLEVQARLVSAALYPPGPTGATGPTPPLLVITNTGQLDLAYTAAYTLADALDPLKIGSEPYLDPRPDGLLATRLTLRQSTASAPLPAPPADNRAPAAQAQISGYLPAGDSATLELALLLVTGDYDLTYQVSAGECPLAGGSAALSVRPALSLEIAGRVQSGPVVTVTATLTNTGSDPFQGTAGLLTDYGYQAAVPILPGLPPGSSRHLLFLLPGEIAGSGLHTATLTIQAEGAPGEPLAETRVSWTQRPAELVIASLPVDTVLPISQTVTLTFSLENRGDLGDAARLRFSMGDLVDEEAVHWLAAGETADLPFRFFVPPDLESRQYLASYDLNGESALLPIAVQGISLTVQAAADRPAYREGQGVSLTLTITNRLTLPGPTLRVLVGHGEVTQTQTFHLPSGVDPAVNLTFPLTATFDGGGLVFYGVYHDATERGIHLNTYRLQPLGDWVTLLTSGGPARPGESVHATVSGPATGSLAVSGPGFSATLALNGQEQPLDLLLPSAIARGTYAVSYRLTGCNCPDDGRQFRALLDVDGPWVRVTEAQLDRPTYHAGDRVTLHLTVASDRELDILLRSGLAYPDGRSGAWNLAPWHLDAGLSNQLTTTVTITDAQAGLHLLDYQLVDAADPSVTHATGAEGFDLGLAVLLGVNTDRADYPAGTESVTATVLLLASAPVTGELSLQVDGAATQVLPVSLVPGRQTVAAQLDLPIAPGRRVLTAALSAGGLTDPARVAATFAYGTALPDLVARPPVLAPTDGGSTRAPNGAGPERTLLLLIGNQGPNPSPATNASLHRRLPGGGETLVATVPVPPIPAGGGATIPVAWDITGLGGEQDLTLTVEPVVEYDRENNSAGATVILPRLASDLVVSPTSIQAGQATEIRVCLANLQATVSLPVTLDVAVYSPAGSVVFSQDWQLELAAGAQQWVTATWTSPLGAVPGSYRVEQLAIDHLGERQANRAALQVVWLPEAADYLVYLPLLLK